MDLVSRRTFVKGLVAGGALSLSRRSVFAAADLSRRSVFAEADLLAQGARRPQEVLRGTSFDLSIGETPMNFTGSTKIAQTINGSIPGPLIRWREGDTVTLRVANRLADEDTSIHWHGIVLPADMDGVPGLSFHGIRPGETFTYQFDVRQAGTYWYHSHSGFQEQRGIYGPLVIEPRGDDPIQSDREHVVLLSDWTDETPERVFAKLKKQSDYYNYGKRTFGDFLRDIRKQGLGATLADRGAWGKMRMNPTDLADVGGATYTHLMNGVTPNGNWTGLFKSGERVRLRFINGSAMTYFDVRIPGLKMTVVAADGQLVHPVTVDEFRIATAETFDVIVEPSGQDAFTIFAQAMDRTAYAAGTLAVRDGLRAPVPAMDPRPLLSMADMGHDMGAHAGHNMAGMSAPKHPSSEHDNPLVDMQATMPMSRLDDPGIGLRENGRRVLTYSDLGSRFPDPDGRDPGRDDRAAPHRPHGQVRVVVRRHQVLGCRAAALHLRRAAAHRPRQRHDDDASDPPARHVERSRKRCRRFHGAQAHHRHAAGHAPHVSRARRRARAMGVSLPPAVSHGSRHVPGSAGEQVTGDQAIRDRGSGPLAPRVSVLR